MDSGPPPIPPRPPGWMPTQSAPEPFSATPPQGQHQHRHSHQQSHHLSPPQQHQIYRPVPGTTWNYILHSPLPPPSPLLSSPSPHPQVYILDLFDTPAATVSALHSSGRRVIAYFSAGSYEDWRPDAALFPKQDLGRKLDGWDGERWLRPGSEAVRGIMRARLDLAVRKGFDGVDPDNVDGYDNKNGLGLGKGDAVGYVRWLAAEAHARGLACGLKNGGEIVEEVVGDVEFCVQEQCAQYGDEEDYLHFVRAGKAVFHVEYPKGEDADDEKMNDCRAVEGKKVRKCMKAKGLGYSTIIKNVRLDEWVQQV